MGNQKPWQELRDQSFAEAVEKSRRSKLTPRNENQRLFLKSMEENLITIATGRCGTGRTWLSCGYAAQQLKENLVKSIVISRPLVQCDEEVGFLPGDLMEKILAEMAPMLDALEDFFSPAEITALIASKKIQVIPLAKMRGKNFRNTIVVLDEAQNATYRQLHMFLTRIGENCRVIVNGDYTQCDRNTIGRNPLEEVVVRFLEDLSKDVGIIQFAPGDIVRSEIVKWVDERLSSESRQSIQRPAYDEWRTLYPREN